MKSAEKKTSSMLPTLTLFYSPRACSFACHVALEEVGAPFRLQPVRVRAGEHEKPEYLAVNPWAKVPALGIDGEVLTEAAAILGYIADLFPQARLLPTGDPLARARAAEWLNFLSSTVHIAFRPMFRPTKLIEDPDMIPHLQAVGAKTLRKALQEVERRLEGRQWALGDAYSVCDPYLLVYYIWSQRNDVVEHSPDMPNYHALAERMFARPAVQRALASEGFDRQSLRLP